MQKQMRYGRQVECDAVFLAAGSGDILKMESALQLPTIAPWRFYLYQALVEALVREARQKPLFRPVLLKIALQHVGELRELWPELVRDDELNRAARKHPPARLTLPYIPAVAVLRRHYADCGDTANLQRLERLLDELSAGSSKAL